MLRTARSVVLGLVVGVLAVLLGSPTASAAPWNGCRPHSLEEKVVRVFPRVGSAGGPAGTSSELQCGNRYYGARRIQAEWGPTAADRRRADAAIARALTTDTGPLHDERSDTWAYEAAGVVVVVGPRGLVIDAHQTAR